MLCNLKTFMNHRQICVGFVVMMAFSVLVYSRADAAPIAVRFPEGVTHGFLLVRSLAGEIIGHGEITQVAKKGDLVESHLVFKFKDGSLHDETVAFTQQQVFTLISYHLVQRGPSFPELIDVAIERGTGEYTVRYGGHDGPEPAERCRGNGAHSRLRALARSHHPGTPSHEGTRRPHRRSITKSLAVHV